MGFRLHIVSDLHLEMGAPYRYTPPPCDAVVLAGDICTGVAGVIWAQENFGDIPTIYVPGNHEFYGGRKLLSHVAKMKAKAEGSNVRVLYNDSVGLGDYEFFGTTLWTDFNLYGTEHLSTMHAQNQIADFHHELRGAQIRKDQTTPFTAINSATEHRVGLNFLSEANWSSTTPHDKRVVVTHHAPSEQSIHEYYKGHPLSPAYASRLDNQVSYMDPALWVHGHTHTNFDYHINNTRVLCNPRGYDKDNGAMLNPSFIPDLVVEI